MEKVRPWCGQPSDRGRLKNKTELEATSKGKERRGIGTEWEGGEGMRKGRYHAIPYSFNNVADIRNLQQYCSIQHYQPGRTKVYDSYIVKET